VLDGPRLHWLRARAVVLATGGGGHLFANTTNPPAASGDGLAIAWQAGAQLRDLEFVQFHPTALMLAGAPHFLISEAVRGEGARLVDRAGASPVAHLSGGDLAPRDQVSRALVQTMAEQGEQQLWLDLRPVGRERLERQFPTILGRCRELGLEPTAAPIPVAPAAHYWMGGVATDGRAATSLPGLYAIGEVASTGVHGANRLASNSLMECLVYARQLRCLEPASVAPPRERAPRPAEAAWLTGEPGSTDQAMARIAALRRLCWQVAGVERHGPHLREALRQVRSEHGALVGSPLLRAAAGQEPGDAVALDPAQATRLTAWQELQQRLVVAERLIEAAAFREESRGGHMRTDAPSPQPFWQRHTLQERGRSIRTSPVGARSSAAP
jgi:L-aspartate oxidase